MCDKGITSNLFSFQIDQLNLDCVVVGCNQALLNSTLNVETSFQNDSINDDSNIPLLEVRDQTFACHENKSNSSSTTCDAESKL
jgi:hypothetical protein